MRNDIGFNCTYKIELIKFYYNILILDLLVFPTLPISGLLYSPELLPSTKLNMTTVPKKLIKKCFNETIITYSGATDCACGNY